MRKLPYLKKNKFGVYYFRFIFSKKLRVLSNSPKELSLSMGTKDFLVAIPHYLRVLENANQLKLWLDTYLEKDEFDMTTLKSKVELWKQANQLNKKIEETGNLNFELRKELLAQQSAKQSLLDQNAKLKETCSELTGALKATKRLHKSALPSPAPSKKPAPAERSVAISSMTLKTLVARFHAFESEHSLNTEKTLKARKIYLQRFLDIVGANTRIHLLNADKIRSYRELIHAIPRNFDKQGFIIPKANGKRPKWFKETIEASELPTLSGEGIETHFKHVRCLLRWAQNEHHLEQDLYSMLVVSKKHAKATKKIVVNFLAHDLHKLFMDGYLYGDHKAAREKTQPWQFWIPLIALTTGMRSEEIGALSASDIFIEEDFWCITVRNSKTDAGERTFPIPQFLLDMGLLDYRRAILEGASTAETPLFPTLKRKGDTFSNRIGQFFNRNINGKLKDGSPRYEGYLHKCAISNPSDKEVLCFHSFRHGFITTLLNTLINEHGDRLELDLVKNIVGHNSDFTKYGIAAESWTDVTRHVYDHKSRVSLITLRERYAAMKHAMDKMDFEVDLSLISFKRYKDRF
ncbi:tyrosine-type recombinase/integrase [Vibrio inusitatus]|nr:tyrosine-type recombinase/integrase [Vibrio inusitatus]